MLFFSCNGTIKTETKYDKRSIIVANCDILDRVSCNVGVGNKKLDNSSICFNCSSLIIKFGGNNLINLEKTGSTLLLQFPLLLLFPFCPPLLN